MGIFSFIKNEFIEVIDWEDQYTDQMVHKFPIEGKQQIKNNAQLIVRPSQVAIFVYEGTFADIYQPGKYTLSTDTMPVLTSLSNWKYTFDSPFKTDVYFVNTKQFTNLKWGTSKPIMMRDQDFGILRLRGYGIYSFKVDQPDVFLKEVFGTNSLYTTDSIEGHLKSVIVSSVADLIAESNIPAMDLAMNYDELSHMAMAKINERFAQFGLVAKDFTIENISLPDAVEEAIDKRTQMGALGDLNTYAKFQTAEAIRDAAKNEGGGFASMGAGIGAGANIGKMMTDAMTETSPAGQGGKACPSCGYMAKPGAKFCPECGSSFGKKCISCHEEIQPSAKFCPHCGADQNPKTTCPHCNEEVSPGSKFCPHCGQGL